MCRKKQKKHSDKFFLSFRKRQFSSVQDGICSLGGKKTYALHHVSQKFPQRCFRNGSNVRLIDDGPLSSFQGRSSSASYFHVSLLQAIDSVTTLALCPHVVSQATQHFRSSEKQATFEGAFPASLSAWSFSFTLTCPGQYTTSTFAKHMNVKVDVYLTRKALPSNIVLPLPRFVEFPPAHCDICLCRINKYIYARNTSDLFSVQML